MYFLLPTGLTDGSRRHLAAPQGLGDILHSAHGNTGKIYLNERFFHAALTAATLNNSSLKGYTPKIQPADHLTGGLCTVNVNEKVSQALMNF